MNFCEKLSEYIVSFRELDASAQESLQNHLSNCQDCRKKWLEFTRIDDALNNQHPVKPDQLQRYSVYLAAPSERDYDGEQLSQQDIEHIESHLDNCPACRQVLQQLSSDYEDIGNYLQSAGLPDIPLAAAAKEKTAFNPVKELSDLIKAAVENAGAWITLPMPRLVPISAAVCIILLAVVLGPWLKPDNPYLQLASMAQERVSFVTRSAVPGQLNTALSAFHQGDYAAVIYHFEAYPPTGNDPNSLFLYRYLVGISHLQQARDDFLGYWPRIRQQHVSASIEHLLAAAELDSDYNMAEECRWFLAKAYLLNKDAAKAEDQLQKLVDLNGRRRLLAEQKLAELSEIVIAE